MCAAADYKWSWAIVFLARPACACGRPRPDYNFHWSPRAVVSSLPPVCLLICLVRSSRTQAQIYFINRQVKPDSFVFDLFISRWKGKNLIFCKKLKKKANQTLLIFNIAKAVKRIRQVSSVCLSMEAGGPSAVSYISLPKTTFKRNSKDKLKTQHKRKSI